MFRSTACSFKVLSTSSLYQLTSRSLFIRTQTTPNPQSLKFIPGRTILESGESRDYQNLAQAQKESPLARTLFRVDGVSSVFLGPDFLSVNISQEHDWELVKPSVFAAITDFFASDLDVLVDISNSESTSGEAGDTLINDDDDEVVQAIKEIIETRVRQIVQDDGGDIAYRGFEEGVVKVELQGSCVGCPSSTITLQNGIKNMLMHYIPEVEDVIGTSPFNNAIHIYLVFNKQL